MISQVQSKHISKSQYGIITLILNTETKWMNYHVDTTQEGLIIHLGWSTYNESDNYAHIEHKEAFGIQWDEIDLDLQTEFSYQQFIEQNKDQIVIYWIPRRLFKGDLWVQKALELKSRT